MKGVKGELGSLPLTDLMQWIEVNRKSGVLFLSNGKTSRCFCFGEGKLLLAASNAEGRRFGDFLSGSAGVATEEVEGAVAEAMSEGRAFLGVLVERGLITKEAAASAVRALAEESVMEVLSWQDGQFRFVEGLPRVMEGSPVRLSTGPLVFESVRRHDEKSRGR